MTHFTIIEPSVTRRLVPALATTPTPDVWVYRFRHATEPWTLSIATHAEPQSGKLSLGGFRIAPAERTDDPAFDPDLEAIGLAMGMEEKVYWSRLMGIGGPLARRDMRRIVGGKCVLEPTAEARVGQPRDFELLDWALECFARMEADSGIYLTTGQDLGHGIMSDGVTNSLDYLAARFRGCVDADTSKPTGEGNYHVLAGMLAGVEVDPDRSAVGLIGVGNIGQHIHQRLADQRSEVMVLEMDENRRATAERMGARAWPPSARHEFLRQPMDALVVNAAARSLEGETVEACIANGRMQVICGSENLAMPEPRDARRLLAGEIVYAPTELGGMMGYLTAVERYLASAEGVPFDIQSMMTAAADLREPARAATELVRRRGFTLLFEDAMRELYAS